MWQRWNGTSHIFEKSDDNGSSWAPLPLSAAILNEGNVPVARLGLLLGTANNWSADQNFANCAVKFSGTTAVVGPSMWANSNILHIRGGTGGLKVQSQDGTGGDLLTLSNAGILTVLKSGTHKFGGAGGGIAEISVDGASGSGEGGVVRFSRGATVIGWVGSEAVLIGGTGNVVTLYAATDDVSMRTPGSARFYSGSTHRGMFEYRGQFVLGALAAFGGGALSQGMAIEVAQESNHNLCLRNSSGVTGGQFIAFYNNVASQQGGISNPNGSSVSYNTTSDQRLKKDLGVVKITDVLAKIVIHDFEWISDKAKSRGIFAQEAIEACPGAITKGTDELMDNGQLEQPWMIDYSKFIPDLIVGWQQHEARIAALEQLNGK